MDDASWAALTLSLTVLGGIWTWSAFRRRGPASGLRALAFTLLPLAAYLTRTLRMFTRIGEAVADWAASLVFNPMVWSGVVVAGVAVVLFVASGFLRSREIGTKRVEKASRAGELPPGKRPARQDPAVDSDVDSDMAEIEAILRKRGIS